jgi:YfiR/HmsC-like
MTAQLQIRKGSSASAGSSRRALFPAASSHAATLFSLLLFFFNVVSAQGPSEYEVKAAFLLNFTKFVDWPPAAFADANSPIALCVLGQDPFGQALDDMIEGEAVSGRKLMVRRITESPAPKTCQVLFVGSSRGDTTKTLGSLGRGVLTVGDGDRFLREGGIIAFVLESGHVRFDINQSAATRAGLKLSSRLLRVARSIEK